MKELFVIFLIVLACYYCWTIFGYELLNKKVLIKRINPQNLKLVGDLILKGDYIFVMYRWRKKEFPIQQIEQIKAYCIVDWGLQEYEQIDIKFTNDYQVKLDGTMEDHQNFIESLMQQLGINNKICNWGFLPQLDDKMGRDVIFERNNIR